MEQQETGTAPIGWFTRRYGGWAAVARSVVAFGVLFTFVGYVIIMSSYLMSNKCFGDDGQMVCPSSGPDWARPLPGAAAFLGLLTGLAGLLAGRPVRTRAMIIGFLLATLGLTGGWMLR